MTEELDDLEALAADYVLGTLNLAERERAEKLLARDPDFAGLVDDWVRRLAPLAEAVPTVEPPAHLWTNIEAAVRERARPGTQPGTQPVTGPATQPGGFQGLWQRAAFWRWCTLGAVAAACAALYLAVTPLIGPQIEPKIRYAAMLSESGASPAWLIGLDPDMKRVEVRPLAGVSPEDKSFELWLIAGADEPPRSLGLLDPDAQTLLQFEPEVPAGPEGALLAVSLEPLGGSPTGLPTGPVVYQGAIFAVEP